MSSCSTEQLFFSQPTMCRLQWRCGELRSTSSRAEYLRKIIFFCVQVCLSAFIYLFNQSVYQCGFMHIYLGYSPIVLYFGPPVVPALVSRHFFSWLLCPFDISPSLSVFGAPPSFLALQGALDSSCIILVSTLESYF